MIIHPYQEEHFKATEIVNKAFKGKKDKGGNPYINHLIQVERFVHPLGYKFRTIALLHDIIEDCKDEWSEDKLREVFPDEIVDVVVLLTRKDGQEYDEYIELISQNKTAMTVKIADLKSNMDITRLPVITKSDLNRIKKYHNSYTKLKTKFFENGKFI